MNDHNNEEGISEFAASQGKLRRHKVVLEARRIVELVFYLPEEFLSSDFSSRPARNPYFGYDGY